MASEEIVEQFEQGLAPGGSFGHVDHIRVAFAYLSRYSALEALQKFSAALQRFAAAQGKPGLYHETITWAYVFLIRERMLRSGRPLTWEEFAETNPDMLTWERETGGVLALYYLPQTLKSDAARAAFLMPDKVGRVA
jgi:hypothetical protein